MPPVYVRTAVPSAPAEGVRYPPFGVRRGLQAAERCSTTARLRRAAWLAPRGLPASRQKSEAKVHENYRRGSQTRPIAARPARPCDGTLPASASASAPRGPATLQGKHGAAAAQGISGVHKDAAEPPAVQRAATRGQRFRSSSQSHLSPGVVRAGPGGGLPRGQDGQSRDNKNGAENSSWSCAPG